MMTDTKLQYHGETVTLKELRCFAWGKSKGYKVVAEYDGIPFAPFEGFWELDRMLELAGHGKPAYYHSKHIPLPDVQAVVEDVNNSYRVKAVYKADGASMVTLQDVITERDNRRAEIEAIEPRDYSKRVTNEKGFFTFGSRKPKSEPKLVDRFAHGEKLHRTSEWFVDTKDGEYIPRKLVA